MPDLNDFLTNKEPESKNTEMYIDEDIPVVGGSFMCQECNAELNTAFFKHKEEKLVWTCPLGHVSSVPFK
jgi:hypothetical protein